MITRVKIENLETSRHRIKIWKGIDTRLTSIMPEITLAPGSSYTDYIWGEVKLEISEVK